MTSPLELIQIVESTGGRFEIDGDRLGIYPKEAAAPVLEELRQHKWEIIELLSQRPLLPVRSQAHSLGAKDSAGSLVELRGRRGCRAIRRDDLDPVSCQIEWQALAGGRRGGAGIVRQVGGCRRCRGPRSSAKGVAVTASAHSVAKKADSRSCSYASVETAHFNLSGTGGRKVTEPQWNQRNVGS